MAVLGANAADKLFDQRVPLGRSFTVRGQQFIVSGVLTKFATTPFASGVNFNDAIFVAPSAIKSLKEVRLDAAVHGVRRRRQNRRHVDLHERRCAEPPASRSARPGTRKRVQRSALNTQCKLLLLTHAFEALDCIAVEFRTHFFNQQSRRGIERLGAELDGILRSRRSRGNGTLRDTCGLQHHRRPSGRR